jgi:hypothetical protein
MFDSSPIDQADEYGRNLLSKKQLSEVEKFNLLRKDFYLRCGKQSRWEAAHFQRGL